MPTLDLAVAIYLGIELYALYFWPEYHAECKIPIQKPH